VEQPENRLATWTMLVNEAREGYREPTRQLTWLSASPAMPFVEQVLAHCAIFVACAVLRSRAWVIAAS
jgi:hypothetical protein